MRKVFISYSSVDRQIAEQIQLALLGAGYEVFFDRDDLKPSDNFHIRIREEIQKSDGAVFLITPASVRKGSYALTELQYLRQKWPHPAHKVIPVLLNHVSWEEIPNYLKAVTILEPQGNVSAEVASAAELSFGHNPDQTTAKFASPPAATRDHRLTVLLEKVKQYWVEGYLKSSLEATVQLELEATTWDQAIANPWMEVLELPIQEHRFRPSKLPIINIFAEAGRSLLILGEPGSGKTIGLLQLADTLSTTALTDPTQPVPVVFNLSTWNGQKGLLSWLIAELRTKYQTPEKLGRTWLEANNLILLLDGLDECEARYRESCIRAINEFIQTYEVPGIAVCSRFTEYTALENHLAFGRAIRVQPLTSQQIDQYFTAAGSRLHALRILVSKDDSLRALAQSPLALSIMTLAYVDIPITSGPLGENTTSEQLYGRVMDAYVDRMFRRKGYRKELDSPHQTITSMFSMFKRQAPRKEQYGRSEVVASLAWMGQRMMTYSQTVFLLEKLQPNWLTSSREQWTYWILSRTIPATTLGIILGLVWASQSMMLWAAALAQLGLNAGIVDSLKVYVVNKTYQLVLIIALYAVGLGIAYYTFKSYFFDTSTKVGINELVVVSLTYWAYMLVRSIKRNTHSDIHTTEVVSWSTASVSRGFIRGTILAALISLILVAAVMGEGGSVDRDVLLRSTFLLSVFGGVAGILFMTFMSGESVEIKSSSNQGVTLTMLNAIVFIILTWLGFLATMGLGALIFKDEPLTTERILGGGVIAILIGFWYGLDVMQHYILRFVLRITGHAPPRYVKFLDYATNLSFLRKVGGGYIFIHRLVMEHFASLKEVSPEQVSGLPMSQEVQERAVL